MSVGSLDVDLVDRVRALLVQARGAYRGDPLESALADLTARLDEPLRVAVAGRVKAGKSTLLNALLGERVAATDAGECTRLVTYYSFGPTVRVVAISPAGQRRELSWARDGDGLRIDLEGLDDEAVQHLLVELPNEELRGTTLIDTPGMGSLSSDLSARTTEWLSGRDELQAPADAIVYLMRQVHVSDVDFLAGFRDEEYTPSSPMTSLGVLSRIDEIGGGGPRALQAAHRLAERYEQEPLLRPLLQRVVPVASLLAEGSRTFTGVEFDDLWTLARTSPSSTDTLFVSARRTAHANSSAVPPSRRRALLDRFGLFGVRTAVETLREQPGLGAEGLADRLEEISGLPELRRALNSQFSQRRDVIKADSAIRALQVLLGRHERGPTADVRMALERVTAGAHEFRELQALHELRTGGLRLPPDRQPGVERLLGAEGTSAASRLGLPPDASMDALVRALEIEHGRWRRTAVNPGSPALRRLAPVLVRTCEGLRLVLSSSTARGAG